MTKLSCCSAASPPLDWKYAPSRGVDGHRLVERAVRALHRWRVPGAAFGKYFPHDQSGDRGTAGRGGRGGGEGRRSRRQGRPGGLRRFLGSMPGKERAKYSSALPAWSRSAHASWRFSKRWTVANRSRSRGMSTSPWWPPTSSTTPDGPTSSNTRFPASIRSRSAWPAR